MRRKDKREEAAYCNVIDICGCGNCPRTGNCQLAFSLMCDKGKTYIRGFMDGSDWSDKHQPFVMVDTLRLWHSGEEVPINKRSGLLIAQIKQTRVIVDYSRTAYGYAVIRQCDYEDYKSDVTQWCYLDEIIPIYPYGVDPYEILKK